MQAIVFLLIMLPLSLATEVFVYGWNNSTNLNTYRKPVFRSAVPWKFYFNNYNDQLCMIILYWNTLANVTHTFKTDYQLFEKSSTPLANVEVGLDLFTADGVCRSVRVAKGRHVNTVRPEQIGMEYEYPYICFKGKSNPCVVVVKSKDALYNVNATITITSEYNTKGLDNSLVTTNRLSNYSVTTNILSNLSGTTNILSNYSGTTNILSNYSGTTNRTDSSNHDAETTDNIIVIIPSILLIMGLVLFGICAIRRYCCKKSYRPQRAQLPLPEIPGTGLESINGPFYLNLLFRRECELEIQAQEEPLYEEVIDQ